MTEFSRTASDGFARPAAQEVAVPARDHGGQHV